MVKVIKKHFAYKNDNNPERTDCEGLTHKQWLDRARREAPEWYEKNKLHLENPAVWEEYLAKN